MCSSVCPTAAPNTENLEATINGGLCSVRKTRCIQTIRYSVTLRVTKWFRLERGLRGKKANYRMLFPYLAVELYE